MYLAFEVPNTIPGAIRTLDGYGNHQVATHNTHIILFHGAVKGNSANAVPTNINYASEFPTFGEIAKVQPDRSAMEGPRFGRTTFMIMVNSYAR